MKKFHLVIVKKSEEEDTIVFSSEDSALEFLEKTKQSGIFLGCFYSLTEVVEIEEGYF